MRMTDPTDALGRALYARICAGQGVTAAELARELGVPRKVVNQRLYTHPLIRDLCYHDDAFRWHALIQQRAPHDGLRDFCGFYGYVAEFMELDEQAWLAQLRAGCARIGRSLADTRGLMHSLTDRRQTMAETFEALRDFGVRPDSWEVAFELRIRRARWVRIFADVLVVSPTHAFSLEFKMKDAIDATEVAQAAKYVPYLELILGPALDVICALVLTRAHDLFAHAALAGGGVCPVASGDMLFNVFDEYLSFLR